MSVSAPPPPTADARVVPDAVEAGVIKEARRRQRRRRAGIGVAAILAGVAGFAVFGGFAGGGDRTARPDAGNQSQAAAPQVVLAPGSLFSQAPYMGVACGIPNSIKCDRIGLTVWLRQPAVSVIASLGGRSFVLSDPMWSGPVHRGERTRFAGFLQPAGITTRLGVTPQGTHWNGSDGPSPLVMLQINRRQGRPLQAWVNVFLAAGWG